MPDEFPEEVRPGGSDRAFDERTEKLIRLIACFQPLWIIQRCHVIPQIGSVNVLDMEEGNLEARKISTGKESAATIGAYVTCFVRPLTWVGN